MKNPETRTEVFNAITENQDYMDRVYGPNAKQRRCNANNTRQ